MPISPLTAASTEHNASTSPPQQLFNNLNGRLWISTAAWFPLQLDKLTTVAPASSSHTYTMQAGCSRGFVRAEKPPTDGRKLRHT